MHFNPRLREGSDDRDYYIYRIRYDISIHASAREATRHTPVLLSLLPISIHASAREATLPNFKTMLINFDFNPRLREGGDVLARCKHISPAQISIHASAREATQIAGQAQHPPYISIHASAREATTLAAARLNFCCISIHASAREATEPYTNRYDRKRISIHASAREATLPVFF